jgi:PAS domain S-box-containing protein
MDDKLRCLADSNIIGIAIGNLAGRIIAGNQAFLNIIGYSQDDLASGELRWDRITPPEFSYLDQNALDQLTRTGIAMPWEKEFLRRDQGRVSVLIGVSMVGERKSSSECISFILDVSEQKRLERELRDAKLAAEASDRARANFLISVSFKSRTLLHSILGMVGMALDTQLTAEQRQYLVTVKESSEALLALTADLIKLGEF